jgi:predicted phosphodiesterase
MKLHILSDLHVEFAPFAPPETDADVVILAGDIHHQERGMAWARAAFGDRALLYVPGNHEYYGDDWDAFPPRLREEARAHGVHLLENDALVIDGVRFLGSTLWTDFDYFGEANRERAMQVCMRYITDFRRIRAARPAAEENIVEVRPGMLTPAHVRARHAESRDWLTARLDEPHQGATVVITHHMPGKHSVAGRYANDLGNAGFASHLDHLMGRADLWVHGHTHDSFDYEQAGTRVLCNPRGYPLSNGSFENPLFMPDLVVEV